MKTAANTDDFIAGFPVDVQKKLEQIRSTVKKIAPTASEAIAYGIPTFKLHGNLVHFSAYRSHIGFYPGATGVEAFKDRLGEYQCSKGAIQFPLDKPLPLQLIRDIVQFRVAENTEKASRKKAR
jgi:uncharacterized protein YdhG (YjbR/CyaY superfamily)